MGITSLNPERFNLLDYLLCFGSITGKLAQNFLGWCELPVELWMGEDKTNGVLLG